MAHQSPTTLLLSTSSLSLFDLGCIPPYTVGVFLGLLSNLFSSFIAQFTILAEYHVTDTAYVFTTMIEHVCLSYSIVYSMRFKSLWYSWLSTAFICWCFISRHSGILKYLYCFRSPIKHWHCHSFISNCTLFISIVSCINCQVKTIESLSRISCIFQCVPVLFLVSACTPTLFSIYLTSTNVSPLHLFML